MIILLVLLIAAVVFLPYIKRALGRAALIRKLKKLCALSKYRLKVRNLFSALFRNFSDGYDLTVDTGKTLYAVKLWDEVYKNSSVVFGSDMRVRLRRKIPDTFGSGNKRSHRISERELGTFPRIPTPAEDGRGTVRILVMHPKGASVMYSDGSEIRKVHSKDRLYGMFVLSRGEFLGVFRRRA